MSEIDQNAAKDGEYKQVPAHIREGTGQFCTGGELWTKNGRCQNGCDHAEHYANDGHPECATEPPSLAEIVARARNRSDTDPSWRTNYQEE